MNDEIIKDRILFYLYERHNHPVNSGKIASDLGLDHSTVFTLLHEMEDDKNVFCIEHQAEDMRINGFNQCGALISHKGIHFKMSAGYKTNKDRELRMTFPKRWWALIAIVAYLAGVISDPLTEMLFPTKKKYQVIKSPTETSRDTLYIIEAK